jgi:Bacteriophage tail sheath protein
MATSYLTPGIYIEEVASGPKPIEAVGTSTAAFIGIAPDAAKSVNELVWINNWTEFTKTFVPKTFVPKGGASTPLSNAVFGFFQNGGGRCCVVNVGARGSVAGGGAGGRKGIDLLEESDDIEIVAIPGFTDAASYDAALSHCEKMQDRVAILDAPKDVSSIDALTQVATASPVAKGGKAEAAGGGSGGGGPGGGGPGGGGPPPPAPPAEVRPRQSDGGFGAFYFPWISVGDPLSGEIVNVPPSGHIAGIYARSDSARGVHKAPANELIRGALDVSYRVTKDEQGVLNPAGVNCIRFFPTEGIRVYGARTVAESASDWRYLNVRRLFNMIEQSIARGTRWVVFEPNDTPLWKAIIRDVSAFLTTLWREGALMGASPEQAFFVQCDEETNPQEVIDAGMVVIVVGIAPVRPAEFVIFRIGQWSGGTETQTV